MEFLTNKIADDEIRKHNTLQSIEEFLHILDKKTKIFYHSSRMICQLDLAGTGTSNQGNKSQV